MIFAIDPGPKESAYVILDITLKPLEFNKIRNNELLIRLEKLKEENYKGYAVNYFAIEKIQSFGMSVGAEVFDTCIWIGRFYEKAFDWMPRLAFIYRKEVKVNLCGTVRAKDTNIRQALIDRFGVVGTKKKPGWFYGVSKDIWSAIAVGVTYADINLLSQNNNPSQGK